MYMRNVWMLVLLYKMRKTAQGALHCLSPHACSLLRRLNTVVFSAILVLTSHSSRAQYGT